MAAHKAQPFEHGPNAGPLAAAWNDRLTAQLTAAMPGLKERAKTLIELVDGAQFLVATRPLTLDDKALKLIDADAKAALTKLAALFEAAPTWDAATLEAIVRDYAEAHSLKLGKVAQPLRAALTGRAVSPPIDVTLALLGREKTLARLDSALEHIRKQTVTA